jgi:hypothetical protein
MSKRGRDVEKNRNVRTGRKMSRIMNSVRRTMRSGMERAIQKLRRWR